MISSLVTPMLLRKDATANLAMWGMCFPLARLEVRDLMQGGIAGAIAAFGVSSRP